MKIADFGIAKMVTDPSDRTDLADPKTSQAHGTPDYAAPEQPNGTADHRADIYSLGVVLYEMLTGEQRKVLSAIVGTNRIIYRGTDFGQATTSRICRLLASRRPHRSRRVANWESIARQSS